jgi:hypothetical protein
MTDTQLSRLKRIPEICTQFLRAAAAYNKKAPPGGRVTQYEI